MTQYMLLCLAFFVILTSWGKCCAAGMHRNKSVKNATKACTLEFNGSARAYRVVVFVDSVLLDVFVNWLVFFTDACEKDLSNLDVICMDNEASMALHMMGIQESPKSFDLNEILRTQTAKYSKLAVIWMKRMEILAEYMRSGVDVIFSDSDAIWYHDPLPAISIYSSQTEVIASRAWFPHNIFEKWGACLCMGFIYIRSGSFGSDFVFHITRYLEWQIETNVTTPDDQYAANHVLYGWNITWPRRLVVGVNSVPDVGTVVRNGSKHSVMLLPHSKFLRKCHSMKASRVLAGIENATVVHCKLPPGNGKAKAGRMRALSLWKLSDGWGHDITLAYNATGYLEWSEAVDILSDSSVVNGTIVKRSSIKEKIHHLTVTINRARQAERAKRESKRKNRTMSSLLHLKSVETLGSNSSLYFNISGRFRFGSKIMKSSKRKAPRDRSWPKKATKKDKDKPKQKEKDKGKDKSKDKTKSGNDKKVVAPKAKRPPEHVIVPMWLSGGANMAAPHDISTRADHNEQEIQEEWEDLNGDSDLEEEHPVHQDVDATSYYDNEDGEEDGEGSQASDVEAEEDGGGEVEGDEGDKRAWPYYDSIDRDADAFDAHDGGDEEVEAQGSGWARSQAVVMSVSGGKARPRGEHQRSHGRVSTHDLILIDSRSAGSHASSEPDPKPKPKASPGAGPRPRGHEAQKVEAGDAVKSQHIKKSKPKSGPKAKPEPKPRPAHKKIPQSREKGNGDKDKKKTKKKKGKPKPKPKPSLQ